MRILLGVTYYRPHVSGLTIYVQRLGEALAARGHTVTVLTSRYASTLPREEMVGGVRVVRVPVAFRVSKGVIMPGYPWHALRLARVHDVVMVNLPGTPLDGPLLALAARGFGRPLVAVHHCDLHMAPGLLNRCAERVVSLDNRLVGACADAVVSYTDDYAAHSPFLSRCQRKLHIIPPPVGDYRRDGESARAFRARHAPAGERLIGFAARFAREKGVEFLLEALPAIEAAQGPTRVLFAGEYESVIGEDGYRERLHDTLERLGGRWCFLGTLDPREMADFYAACDVTVLPSVNSTESFGLVQVESMLCGTPVVASDIPGVRVSVKRTGMGRTAAAGDARALAEGIIDVLRRREVYVRPREDIQRHFSLDTTLYGYETLLEELIEAKADAPVVVNVERSDG